MFRSTDAFDTFFPASTITPIQCQHLFQYNTTESHREFPKSKHSQIPFKTQTDFLRTLDVRSDVMCARKVNYLTRTIRFSSADSKSLTYDINGLFYDIAPHWLRYLPPSLTNTANGTATDQNFSECFFSRANLSFSHFVATDLAQLLVADRFLPKEVPIVTPWLTSWQKSLLEFFCISRRVIKFGGRCTDKPFHTVGFYNSYAIEDLSEYEGMNYCRIAAQALLEKNTDTHSNRNRPIIWLGRSLYEASRGLKPRIENLRDMVPIMKKHSVIYIDPIAYSLQTVANLVYDAALIISESGSHFINYLLFSHPSTPIIQLSPHGTLTPTWSYYNVNNMQWYHPVVSQLFFFGGHNPIQSQRRHGSPWNVPSWYDPFGLSCLISDLLHA